MQRAVCNSIRTYKSIVQFEYQTQNSAKAIETALSKYFILPCWIGYNLRKDNTGSNQNKSDRLMDFYFQLMEEKYLGLQSAENYQSFQEKRRSLDSESSFEQLTVKKLWQQVEKKLDAKQRSIPVRMFKSNPLSNQVVTIFHLTKQKVYQSQTNSFRFKDIIFFDGRKNGNLERYEINIKLDFKFNQPLEPHKAQKYWKNPDYINIKLLKFQWIIQDRNHFFEKLIEVDPDNMLETQYYSINPIISRNQIVFPYQEPKLKKNKTFNYQHLNLAFQGGGAKGLAYVGAYKAIKQSSSSLGQSIPIKSIIGSSAGGIIALAASTNIPEYQIERICYKMKDIPQIDRIAPKDTNDQREKSASIKQTIKKLLKQYGILQQSAFQKLQEYLSDPHMSLLQQKLVRYLEAISPSIGIILKHQAEVKTTEQPGFFGKIRQYFLGRTEKPQKQLKVNWKGLLHEGALMKGDSIHNIGAECLIKFFLKLRFQNPKNYNKVVSRQIKSLLREYVESCYQIVSELKVGKIINEITNEILNQNKSTLQIKNQRFLKLIAALINKYILFTDSYIQKRFNDSKGLKIYQNRKELVVFDSIWKNFKGKKLSFWQFIKKYAQSQKPNKVKEQLNEIFNKDKEKAIQLSYTQLSTIFKGNFIIDKQFNSYFIASENIQNELQEMNILNFCERMFGQQFPAQKIKTIFKLMIFQEQAQQAKSKLIKSQDSLTVDDLFFAFQASDLVIELIGYPIKQPPTTSLFHSHIAIFQKLRTQVGKITLEQYYKMNEIELTCTSVDLDNKILRFFNHKTTPQLPVCKAVQMTGSFPVGFKAQIWQKGWGHYHVQHQHQLVLKDIEGHQFTDGGLLANFPIKYMDNEKMRKVYFSHQPVQKKTILLGFGLDYLPNDRYEPSEIQRRQQMQNKEKAVIALKDLIGNISKVKAIIGAWRVTSSSGQQDLMWNEIKHYIIDELPLVRFLLKIMYAYPNSDRNLNIQAFRSKIIDQKLQLPWITYYHQFTNELNNKKYFIKQSIFQMNAYKKKKELTIPTNVSQQNKMSQGQQSSRYLIQQPGKHHQANKLQMQLQNQHQNTMAQSFSKRILQQKITELKESLAGKKKLYELEHSHSQMTDNVIEAQDLSKMLIKIFLIHLKMKENKAIAIKYSRYYAFMKFVAKTINNDKRQQDRQFYIQDDQDVNLLPKLNRINFQNLYERKDMREISYHLDFWDFQNYFYEDYIKHQTAEIDSKRSCCRCILDCICCSKDANWEKQQLQLIYKERESILKKYKQEQRQYDIKLVQEYFAKHPFSDMKLYDISDCPKRSTQFLYLFIRGRDKQNKVNPNHMKILSQIVKEVNFEDLLKSKNLCLHHLPGLRDLSKDIKKKMEYHQNAQQLKNNKDQKKQLEKLVRRLEFQQILQFMKKEIFKSESPTQFENIRSMKSNGEFQIFLRLFKGKEQQEKQEVGEIKEANRIKEEENKLKLLINLDQWYKFGILLKDNNLKFEFELLFFDKYNQTLMDSLKKQIINQLSKKDGLKQNLSLFLYEMLYNKTLPDKLTTNKGGYFSQIYRKQRKVPQNKQLQEISYFLQQIISDQDQPGVSISQNQRIIRNRNNSLHAILNLLLYNQDQAKKYMNAPIITQINLLLSSFIKNVKKQVQEHLQQTKTLQLRCKQENIPKIKNYYLIQILKRTQLASLKKLVGTKLKSQPSQRLIGLHTKLYQDLKILLSLIQQIQLKLNTSRKELRKISKYFDYFLKQYFRKNKQLKQAKKSVLQNFQQTFKQLLTIHDQILSHCISNYYNMLKKKVRWNQQNLMLTYIIKFQHIKKLISKFYAPFYILLGNQKNVSNENNEFKVIRQIIFKFQKIFKYYFSLPMLNSDMNIIAKSMQMEQRNKIKIKLFLPPESKQDKKVHLIYQGILNSNQYMGGLYMDVLSTIQSEAKQHDEIIKAITCSNFNCIFGILLSLRKRPQFIRREMYRLTYVAYLIQDYDKTQKFFDSYAWTKTTPHRINEYIQYLEQEHDQFFNQLQKLKDTDLNQVSLNAQYTNIKLNYMHNKHRLFQTYQKIIDQTTQNMEMIQRCNLCTATPLEISKKFAYQFESQLNQTHNYKESSKKSFEMFKYIANKLIQTFGTLVQGIVGSLVGNYHLNFLRGQRTSRKILKAILTNRLLTTFRLKQYIIDLLKRQNLSSNITLNEFYYASERRILLNFTVLNVSKQILTFINYKTMPNMPLWAAVLATSALPFLNRYFQGNRQWEGSGILKVEETFIYDFFKGFQDKDSRITLYTSGNMISSLPLQLLSNGSIQKKIFSDDETYQNMNEVAVVFHNNIETTSIGLQFQRNYLNITSKDYCKFGCYQILPKLWNKFKRSFRRCLPNCCNPGNPQNNNKYVFNYDLSEEISHLFGSQNFSSTFTALSESNDNFTMKQYYNKVIRLPIKLNTLDFHQIIDKRCQRKYGVNVLSEKGSDTIERSYQITKHFIYNISSRINDPYLIESNEQQLKQRYTVKLRVQIIDKSHQVTGFCRKHLKLQFLNHSKWNLNNYNNFTVFYLVNSMMINPKIEREFTRMKESSIMWLVQQSTSILLKFYYIFPCKANSDEIHITQFELQFKPLVMKRAYGQSFDYEFQFGWNQVLPKEIKELIKNGKSALKPIKRNGKEVSENILYQYPSIELKLKDNELTKNNKKVMKYTKTK